MFARFFERHVVRPMYSRIWKPWKNSLPPEKNRWQRNVQSFTVQETSVAGITFSKWNPKVVNSSIFDQGGWCSPCGWGTRSTTHGSVRGQAFLKHPETMIPEWKKSFFSFHRLHYATHRRLGYKLSFSYHYPGQFRLRQSPLEVLQSIRIEFVIFVMIACSRTVSEQECRAWNREVSNPGFCDEAVRKSRHAWRQQVGLQLHSHMPHSFLIKNSWEAMCTESL